MASKPISKTFNQQKPAAPRNLRKRKADLQPESLGAIASAPDSDLTKDQNVLRQFDLATKFGPCVGSTRLERWQRADKFGLDPPADVREIIMRCGVESEANLCLWHNRV